MAKTTPSSHHPTIILIFLLMAFMASVTLLAIIVTLLVTVSSVQNHSAYWTWWCHVTPTADSWSSTITFLVSIGIYVALRTLVVYIRYRRNVFSNPY
ncbi:MAG: hypothetical protein M1835_004134, partial [Candelina submexicana]